MGIAQAIRPFRVIRKKPSSKRVSKHFELASILRAHKFRKETHQSCGAFGVCKIGHGKFEFGTKYKPQNAVRYVNFVFTLTARDLIRERISICRRKMQKTKTNNSSRIIWIVMFLGLCLQLVLFTRHEYSK